MAFSPALLLALFAQGTSTAAQDATAAKTPPDPAILIREMTDKLVGIQTIKGKFQLSLHQQPLQNGEFKFKKPDMFAITGVDVEQYHDGKVFFQWDKLASVYDRQAPYRLASVPYMTGYEAFFGLISGHVTTGIEASKIGTRDAWAVLLEPPKDVKTYKLFFDQETKMPLGWSMLFNDGNQASVKVNSVETDTPLPDTQFMFVRPKDAKTTQQMSLTEELLPNGTQLPDFMGVKHSGGNMKFSEYATKKKATMLMFWFADCEACKDAIPAMRDRLVPLAKQGLGALSLNVGDAKELIEKKGKEWKLDMHHFTLEPTGNIVKLFKVVAYPTFYLVGPDGKVWMRSVGYDKQALDAGLKALGFKL